ncbi:hypothetical protein [Salininema proteolyticum]|uniref:Uncharacterized protein n=1 Tax=Salininema proteolyticum TaxID=1607685 RepID=A0ABV8TZH3_9ACTN
MKKALTQRERFILLALMVHRPPEDVTNPQLKDAFGVDVKKGERENLEKAGFLAAVRARGHGNPFMYELTPDGRRRAVEELAGSPDPKSTVNVRVVYALFNAVHRFLERNHLSGESVLSDEDRDGGGDVPVPSNTGRVEKEYRNLVEGQSAWVPMRELRESLSSIERAELDDTLRILYNRRLVRMVPEANRRRVTDADEEAAVEVAGTRMHWVAFV